MNNKILYIIVPCYNEEEVLIDTSNKLKNKINSLILSKKISNKSKIMFVDDGSSDKTWEYIKEISSCEKVFTGISLSRNFGHQNALVAGLLSAKEYADVVITMDADLQDDINAIDLMLDKYYSGSDIVYGVRNKRKNDSYFKRMSAQFFYKFMNFLGAECIYNHADYRLTSKKVLNVFSDYKEVNLFLRGIFPLIGFNSSCVYYERLERTGGKSKYSLKKMFHFACDGITSFSIKPLRFICLIGFLILIISVFIMVYSLIRKLNGNTVDGWTFLAISIWFIGGLQMTSIGIIGEYIGKIYGESKSRPRFIVAEDLNKQNEVEV